MSCNDMVCRRRLHAILEPLGRRSFGPTWHCWRGTEFFTAEVLTALGLVTYYVLLIIHLESRRVVSPALPSTRTSLG